MPSYEDGGYSLTVERGYVGRGDLVNKADSTGSSRTAARGTTGGSVSKPQSTVTKVTADGKTVAMTVADRVAALRQPSDAAIYRTPPSLSRTPTSTSSRTPPSSTSPGKVPMPICDVQLLSIEGVLDMLGARRPTGLSNNLVLGTFMAEGAIPVTGTDALDLIATAGTVWSRDEQVQRVVSGQFASSLWGMYASTMVLVVSGIQELLDAGTITNLQLEAIWRSFQVHVVKRNGAPIAYTMLGGVGIQRHGASGPLAAAAAVGPLNGPASWSFPAPIAFNANEVTQASILYVPGTSGAPTQTVLNTGTCRLNAYFGGMMWKNDGSVVPPEESDCRPADYAAPVRLRSQAQFVITA